MQIAYKPIRNLIAFLMIGAVLYYLFGMWSNHMNNGIKENHIQFHKTEMKGEIERLSIKYHMTSFTLQGDKYEYIVNPDIDTDGHIFGSLAAVGDSIIKAPNGDTLMLVKGFQKHTFPTRKILAD